MVDVLKGLEGVVAATTRLSLVEGETGTLLYAGYNIHDLAERSSFEETAYLLWHGRLPTRKELEGLREALAISRVPPPEVLDALRSYPRAARPIDVLRTAVSTFALYDPQADDRSPEGTLARAVRLSAQFPAIVAVYHRLRSGLEPVAPDPTLDHAANFLFMLTGKLPDDVARRAIELVLILQADHGLNASTFTARVVASTLADVYSAVAAAIGALRGPLHGGASEAAMRMLLEIGEPESAQDYVRERLARRERIMGFGHRVYRTEDPRATHLRRWARIVGEQTGQSKWFEIARRIEDVMNREKGLNCNVDFYSAPLYYALGIPPDLTIPVFACSRIVGWTAHVREQYADNRLIRPEAEYVGPVHLRYASIEERA